MKLKFLLRAALVALLALSVAACGNAGGGEQGGGGGGEGDGPSITVGSKNFTEQFVLGELYAQALEARGFTVERQLNLGSEQIADRALQDGQIDFYPEYTGTALVALLDYSEQQLDGLDTPEATYEEARRLYSERDPANTMLTPADFNNNYGIFVRRDVAEEQGIETLEDLAEASGELRFATYSEFQDRSDGYKNMQENYPGLDFGEIITANDLGLRYQGVTDDRADVGVGFLTDGQLTSDDLVVLEDTKGIWPFYYPAPVVRSDVLEQNPEMEEILNSVSATLNVDVMRDLNGRVDLQQEEPADVAQEHLEAEGLLEQQ
ncbi:glycine/betaine ABC transporter substrate-binding protein [Rubrobacter marinus]|uniref:Glycine/betaine ABC transporter substrate-binding protein n=1 Tax=Rubrobacter marinus TaxID=2653852 RepID=A0A6G8PWR6_9ACTN|nr:glycine betaine ABC transporter substrate-binding protein [Rubrobacter marinus]QIN78638.1 glycine/betaine ABC transporter substrate-binding protein [Rubrobacter marinus]